MEKKRKRRTPAGKAPEKRFARTKRTEKAPEPVRAPAQEVVYTAPEPVNFKKFALYAGTIVAAVLVLFMSFSIFFKVGEIRVSGNVKYDEWTISQASGIEKGDGLLTFGKAKACARIAQKLPYVKIVRIGIELPNKVNIYVEELDVVYAAQDTKEGWWLLTSDGRVVEQTSASNAKGKTNILGVVLDSPVAGKNAKAYEPEPQEEVDGETKPVTVTNQDRLDTALTVAAELERRSILNKVSVIDVEDMTAIELWYGDAYQVKLGDPGDLTQKLGLMQATIQRHEKEGAYQSGILDISFEIYTNGVGYEPFEEAEN